MTINLGSGSLLAAGGCTGSSTFCGASYVHTFRPPVTNPFSALDSITMPTLSNCSKSWPDFSSATAPCTGGKQAVKLSGNGNTPVSGVYFISGTLTLTGGASISGTALFILLPGASIDTKGGGTINITGISDVTSSQVPAAFQQYTEPSCQTTSTPSCLLNNMAIYDQSSVAVSIGGNSSINFDGTMYLPNAAVTLQGNPTLDNSNCEKLIVGSLAFNGNPSPRVITGSLAVYAPAYLAVSAVGVLMRKLDQPGVATPGALSALPLFTLMFAIFDLERYAIMMQSLRSLANAGARTIMIDNCYVHMPRSQKTSPTCSGDPLPTDAAKQAVAPFLVCRRSQAPTLNVPATTTSPLVVTASQNFTMIMPIWGTALNTPSASTSVPF